MRPLRASDCIMNIESRKLYH